MIQKLDFNETQLKYVTALLAQLILESESF